MKKLLKAHDRKIRYLATGMWNTLFGYGCFAILCRLGSMVHVHYLFALVGSQVLGTTNTFLSYKHFVFKTKGGYLREYFRFSLVYWVLFILNLCLLPVVVNAAHIGPILAQGMILPVTVVASYFFLSRFSFKNPAF
jgi:putative flippase GtrA